MLVRDGATTPAGLAPVEPGAWVLPAAHVRVSGERSRVGVAQLTVHVRGKVCSCWISAGTDRWGVEPFLFYANQMLHHSCTAATTDPPLGAGRSLAGRACLCVTRIRL